MVVPSRRLVWLLAGAAPVLAVSGLFEPLQALALLYLTALVAVAVLDAITVGKRSRLAIERLWPERLSLGAGTRVGYRLVNPSRRKVRVSLAERLPPQLVSSPPTHELWLEPGEEVRLEAIVHASARGKFELEGLDLRVQPAGALFMTQQLVSPGTQVHVYPNLQDVRRYELLLRRGLMEQGLARLAVLGLGSEFESLRLYNEGEDLGRMDWKATARRAAPIARNLQAERQQYVMALIDCGRTGAGQLGDLTRLDYFVNAALVLAYAALRQGDWFSLVAFSDRIDSYLPPVRGPQSLERVARALHELEPRLVEPDYAAAFRFMGLKHRRRGLIVVMTDVVDRDANDVLIGSMSRFARYHLPVAVTLRDPSVFAEAGRLLADGADPFVKAAASDTVTMRDQALSLMRQQGVSVLDVEPKMLTPELLQRYLRIKATHRL